MSGAPALAPPRRAGARRALAFAFVFLCGSVFGAGAALFALRRTALRVVGNPELRVERASRWLGRRLSLDAAQQARVRVILEGQASELDQLRLEVWPRVLARLDRTEGEIARELSPAQQARWRALAAELRGKWLPPPASEKSRS
ncbi:MAG TPA: hypothetical protein VNI01_07965 [Elusimicrobiota bacterium]|nr:hypothetical protein [Elusimicrobiota bacterium]